MAFDAYQKEHPALKSNYFIIPKQHQYKQNQSFTSEELVEFFSDYASGLYRIICDSSITIRGFKNFIQKSIFGTYPLLLSTQNSSVVVLIINPDFSFWIRMYSVEFDNMIEQTIESNLTKDELFLTLMLNDNFRSF